MDLTRRELAWGAAGMAALTASGATAWAALTDADPAYALIDPELIPALSKQPRSDLSADTLEARRNRPATVSPTSYPPPAPQLQALNVPGLQGEPSVRIFVVDPSPGRRDRPAYLYIHGGGYVMFAADRDPGLLQRIAIDNDCVVVAVDYRLAPEARFPAALNDNYGALLWLHSNAEKLGVDRNRIAVGGESAGGGHAAALAIRARDEGRVKIAFQLLIYPMLDDRTGSSRKVSSHIGRFVWTEASNRFGWSSYLGVPAGSKTVPAGAVPARVDNLAGLPPTFIGVGALDLFVEENVEYARRLLAAGVATELHVEPGAFHGFDLMVPNALVSQRFRETWKDALRRGLLASNHD